MSKIGAEEKTNISVIWRKVKISSDCFKKIDLRSSMQRTEAAIKKFHFLKLKIAILPIEHFTTHARTYTRTFSYPHTHSLTNATIFAYDKSLA